MIGDVILGTNDLPRRGVPRRAARRNRRAAALGIGPRHRLGHGDAQTQPGRDEGAVGPRGEGFDDGYFRDLDGNKLNVFVMG
jgi:hypothetical protein